MEVEYKIIGGDGVEYGPATLDELTSWIGEGRVAGATQVWRSDLALWSSAGRYAELQQALSRLHASASPAAKNQMLRPVGFWPRLGAYMLDYLVIGLVFSALWGPIAQWKHLDTPIFPRAWTDQSARDFVNQLMISTQQAVPFLYILIIGYDVVMNGSFGATMGKMAIGAKIICIDGSPIGYSRALLRSLAARLVEITFYWGYVMVALRSDKRGLHDLLAGTKVVCQR